jgi:hypothetical protein
MVLLCGQKKTSEQLLLLWQMSQTDSSPVIAITKLTDHFPVVTSIFPVLPEVLFQVVRKRKISVVSLDQGQGSIKMGMMPAHGVKLAKYRACS